MMIRINLLPVRQVQKREAGRQILILAVVVVIGGLVVDVAGDVLLFQTADAVFEAGRARHRPRPRQRIGIAEERLETFRVGAEFRGKGRQDRKSVV